MTTGKKLAEIGIVPMLAALLKVRMLECGRSLIDELEESEVPIVVGKARILSDAKLQHDPVCGDGEVYWSEMRERDGTVIASGTQVRPPGLNRKLEVSLLKTSLDDGAEAATFEATGGGSLVMSRATTS